MEAYIKEIELINISAIDYINIKFETPIGYHIISGDNSSGKSTILKAISLCLLGKNYVYHYLTDTLLKIGEKDGFLKVVLNNDIDISVDLPSKKLYFDDRAVDVWDNHNPFLMLAIGSNRKLYGGINQYQEYKTGQFNTLFDNTYSFSLIKWLLYIGNKSRDNSTRTQDIVYSMKNVYLCIKKMINDWNFIEDIKLSRLTPDGVFFVDRNGLDVDMAKLGESNISMLVIFFEILRQMVRLNGYDRVFNVLDTHINLPGIVMIDDVDIHLSDKRYKYFVNWLKTYFPNIQFIVTANNVDVDNAIILK